MFKAFLVIYLIMLTNANAQNLSNQKTINDTQTTLECMELRDSQRLLDELSDLGLINIMSMSHPDSPYYLGKVEVLYTSKAESLINGKAVEKTEKNMAPIYTKSEIRIEKALLSFDIVMQKLRLALRVNNSNEEQDRIAENPFLVFLAKTDEHKKSFCRTIAKSEEAKDAVRESLGELARLYYLKNLELELAHLVSIHDDERNSGKDIAPKKNNRPKNKKLNDKVNGE